MNTYTRAKVAVTETNFKWVLVYRGDLSTTSRSGGSIREGTGVAALQLRRPSSRSTAAVSTHPVTPGPAGTGVDAQVRKQRFSRRQVTPCCVRHSPPFVSMWVSRLHTSRLRLAVGFLGIVFLRPRHPPKNFYPQHSATQSSGETR